MIQRDYIENFEKIYKTPLSSPWTFEKIPLELVDLVESKTILPCKVLDIGCGEGYISIFLASKGFSVTGIDAAQNAIRLAKQNAEKAGQQCQFIQMNWHTIDQLTETFDFIVDWRILHHLLSDEDRRRYVQNVRGLLSQNGSYVSASYNDETPLWGRDKIRQPAIGAPMHFATHKELTDLFSTEFTIIDSKTMNMPNKGTADVVSSYFLMKPR